MPLSVEWFWMLQKKNVTWPFSIFILWIYLFHHVYQASLEQRNTSGYIMVYLFLFVLYVRSSCACPWHDWGISAINIKKTWLFIFPSFMFLLTAVKLHISTTEVKERKAVEGIKQQFGGGVNRACLQCGEKSQCTLWEHWRVGVKSRLVQVL